MRDLLGNLPRGLPGNTCTLTHALEMRRDSPAGTGQYLSFNGSECCSIVVVRGGPIRPRTRDVGVDWMLGF